MSLQFKPDGSPRRDPLSKDYQCPTHGVDCDCPTCRGRGIVSAGDFQLSGHFVLRRDYEISCPIPTPKPGHWMTADIGGTLHRWWVEGPEDTPWAV